MKRQFSIVLLFFNLLLAAIGLSSCGSSSQVPLLSQSTPRGAFLLFKNSLDSNDIGGATRLMAHPSGRTFLAIEQYEMRDEVARLQRVLNKAQVTAISPAECVEQNCRMVVEFDYSNKINIQTSRIGDRWFITAIGESLSHDD